MKARRTWHDWYQFVTAMKADRYPLRGVVLYEDGPTAMVAKDSFEQAFPELVRDGGNPLMMWKFDMICLPSLLTCAARDIRNADIIYIAARGHDALPGAVKACLEKGLASASHRPRALVAELDSVEPIMTDGDLPTVRYLKRVARRARADFFMECGSSLTETYPTTPPLRNSRECHRRRSGG